MREAARCRGFWGLTSSIAVCPGDRTECFSAHDIAAAVYSPDAVLVGAYRSLSRSGTGSRKQTNPLLAADADIDAAFTGAEITPRTRPAITPLHLNQLLTATV